MAPLVDNLILFSAQLKGAGFQQLSKQTKVVHQNLFSLKNLFTSFVGYDIYSSIRNLIPSLVQTSQQLGAMKSRFNAVSESASAGADELNWIGQQSKRLGLDFIRTADDYSIFFATVSKNMGQKQTREVFENWAETFRVLHIDPEHQTRVLYALREMSSKGKIYMQDLALQLGSAVPDAMNIAAKSMGYTGPKAVEKFRKAIKDGSVDVKKFIPAFSTAINKQYVSQQALAYAMQQTDAQLQTLATHWTFIQKNILESGLQEDIIKILQNTNSLLDFIEKHSKTIYNILKGLLTVLISIFALRGVSFLMTKGVSILLKLPTIFASAITFLVFLESIIIKIIGLPAWKLIFSIFSKGGNFGWIALLAVGIGYVLSLITKKLFPNVWKDIMAYWGMFLDMVYSLLDEINNHPAIKALKQWFGTNKNPNIQLPGSSEQKAIEGKYPNFQFLASMASAKDAVSSLPFMPGGGLGKYPARMLGATLQQQISNFFQPKNTITMTINSNGAPEDVANEVARKLEEHDEKQKRNFARSISGSKNSTFNPFPLSTGLGLS